ncbi:uncharacterized protein LOC109598111 [Aethina tumida]|uniref:uncharacterized protein LOC109598111 n=1 Tax=Aethina tumida TaxID=116153 RepID=UPI00096B248B|nr:uncharacterized protein LOC109598111 [Aethina tumida]
MTSTSINVGFSGQRNSSRVLSPPGGHSSIFGTPEEVAQKPEAPTACGEEREPVKAAEVAEQPGTPEEKPPEVAVKPQPRARVPPGGYSSGLW